MAIERASAECLQDCVDFQVKDANCLDLTAESFDIVWVIECAEHLTNKSRFIEECARVLKPGGTLAICAWVAAERPRAASAHGSSLRFAQECFVRHLPASATTSAGYARAAWNSSELTISQPQVEQTWEHCARIAARPEVQAALLWADAPKRRFVRTFSTIRRAYADGAMAYGIFTARKPRAR
jgi:tocopherol O-methyltransferase